MCSETSQENVHLRDPEKGLKKEEMEGAWVVGWVEWWILNFDSHHDLRGGGMDPPNPPSGSTVSLFLSLCFSSPPLHVLPLTQIKKKLINS